jgi:hypothetical protein
MQWQVRVWGLQILAKNNRKCVLINTRTPRQLITNNSHNSYKQTIQYVVSNFFLITNLTHFLQCIYFTSLHVSRNQVLIIRRINCLNTSSGIYHSGRWLSGMPVRREYLTGIPDSHLPEWCIPDDVLIQLILLMMSTGLLETCREVK